MTDETPIVRAKTGKKVASVLSDESARSAAERVASILSAPVYLWCRRNVSAYQAAQLILDRVRWGRDVPKWPSAALRAAARDLFGANLKLGTKSVDRNALVRSLAAEEPIRFRQAMMFSYVEISGPIKDHGVDPKDPPKRFDIDRHGVIDTSENLLESFRPETVFVETLQDIRDQRTDVSEADLRRVYGFVEPPNVGVANRLRERDELTRRVLAESGAMGKTRESVTFARIAASAFAPETRFDVLTSVFVEASATQETPLVRLGNHALGSIVTRIYEPMRARISEIAPSAKKTFLQVLLPLSKPDGSFALLEILPEAYTVTFRFNQTDDATLEDLRASFPAVNAFLARVSIAFPALEASCLRTDAMDVLPLPGGRPRLLDLWTTTELLADKKLPEASRVYSEAIARGSTVLHPVNISTNEKRTYLQFIRSDRTTRQSLMLNFLARNSGSSAPSLIKRLVSDFGVDAEEASRAVRDFQEDGARNVSRVPVARLDRQTAMRMIIRLEAFQDERHVARAARAVKKLVEWSSGERDARRRIAPDAGSLQILREKTQSAPDIADLDDFYEFLPGSGPPQAPVRREESTGATGDILRTLQAREPSLFGFKANPPFKAYSVQCQDRQPVPLSSAELRRAREGSTEDALGRPIAYKGPSGATSFYACPEKFCVASGVARKKGEECPDPEELFWERENALHPGFLSSARHPEGLCMPCCFTKRPEPGSVVFERIQECSPDVSEDDVAKQVQRKYVSRADRVLDRGEMGRLPASVERFFGDEALRIGGGSSDFFGAVSELAGVSRRTLLEKIRAGLRFEHFLQGDPRRFSPGQAGPDASFRSWWVSDSSKRYRESVGLKTSAIDDDPLVYNREFAAYRSFRESLLDTGREDHEHWLAPINAAMADGVFEWPATHIYVVTEDGSEAFCSTDLPRPQAKSVSFVFNRAGRYEVVVSKPGQKSWQFDSPSARRAFRAGASLMPRSFVGTTRVLASIGHVRAVHAPSTGALVALASPVGYRPEFQHVHAYELSKRSVSQAKSSVLARKVLGETRNAFYRNADRLAADDLANAERDLVVLPAPGTGSTDERLEILEPVSRRQQALRDHAEAVLAAIGSDASESESTSVDLDPVERIRKLTAKYGKAIRRSTGMTEAELGFVLERIVRPVGFSAVPYVSVSDDETLISSAV